ncbi:sensor histidine kinase [Lachnotalea glycerini]|uniref:histidine kinase n=1 Tax=Lachnotalea glycerini TaxID=1763509 RepID=A0A371J7H4_9FIRM|nr:HAMP domain-containing sensor histidine kinase [Lachnotalea glycerini]RDY28617.1 sensor histidine kinase [Lachnotalea glycerini]
MKSRIYLKFILAYLLFGVLSFITVATLTSDSTMNHLKEKKAESLYKVANIIVSKYASGFYKGELSIDTFHNHLEAMGAYLSATIWIVDSEGKIIINSEETTDLNNLTVIENFDRTISGSSYYQTGNFYGMFDQSMLSVISPITSNYKVKGYLIILTPMSEIIASKDRILNITFVTLVVIFLLSTIIMIAFTFMVYLPIRKITTAANEYAQGNLKYELDIRKQDEIGYLANTLNYMSSELNKSEEYQKKFIANISHDFRSPLTSIKGYVEAIIDGTIPVEMQEKYLKIILFETERLTKLTSSLLTLNDFNTKAAMLEISDFDINKVIKKTASTFEGTCKDKKISIELILTGHHLYVAADMSKIQQVLYNLIDNAIKFSHNNSNIFVETTEKNGKIFVSVKDTGIGIPKDSLKKIWERFYKSDLSRGKDKKGTGLGLSIVKEIIQAHSENINVISTEGVGTEFIFTLPLSKTSPREN